MFEAMIVLLDISLMVSHRLENLAMLPVRIVSAWMQMIAKIAIYLIRIRIILDLENACQGLAIQIAVILS